MMKIDSRLKVSRTVLSWKLGIAFLRGCQARKSSHLEKCGDCSRCVLRLTPPVKKNKVGVRFLTKYPAMGEWSRAASAFRRSHSTAGALAGG